MTDNFAITWLRPKYNNNTWTPHPDIRYLFIFRSIKKTQLYRKITTQTFINLLKYIRLINKKKGIKENIKQFKTKQKTRLHFANIMASKNQSKNLN